MAIQGVSKQSLGEKKVYAPLPDGSYTVNLNRVKGASRTKKDNGTIVNVSYQVTDGEFKNRLIWDSFLISHDDSPRAAGIGLQNLDKMLKSIGVYGGFEAIGNDASQLEQFIGKEFIVKVKTEENAGFSPRNKVTNYSRK